MRMDGVIRVRSTPYLPQLSSSLSAEPCARCALTLCRLIYLRSTPLKEAAHCSLVSGPEAAHWSLLTAQSWLVTGHWS